SRRLCGHAAAPERTAAPDGRLRRKHPARARRHRSRAGRRARGTGRPPPRLLRRHRVRVASLPIPHRDDATGRDVRNSRDPAAPRAHPGRRAPPQSCSRAPCRVHRAAVLRGGGMTLYGGIEGGGSKWECAIGTGADDLRARATIPTTTPVETIDRVVAFFESGEAVRALG